jgi:hypothetical protein
MMLLTPSNRIANTKPVKLKTFGLIYSVEKSRPRWAAGISTNWREPYPGLSKGRGI